jgi:hypothetical protein
MVQLPDLVESAEVSLAIGARYAGGYRSASASLACAPAARGAQTPTKDTSRSLALLGDGGDCGLIPNQYWRTTDTAGRQALVLAARFVPYQGTSTFRLC